MRKYALMLLLLCLHSMTRGQTYSYIYWFDDDLSKLQVATSATGQWEQSIDVSFLDDSFHSLHVVALDADGHQSQPMTRFFLKESQFSTADSINCVCSVDGQLRLIEKLPNRGGVLHWDMDMSDVSDGIHSIQLQAMTPSGTMSDTYVSYFMKTPASGNGITWYQYWQNDDDISEAKSVTLTKTNPLQLMTLLPVNPRPLRSKQFHFEVKDGHPYVFADNTIHLRFYDATMRFSDVSRDFVDYRVGEQIQDIATLTPTQKVAYPTENGIKWFSFQAEKGDRLEFKTDKPCTLQLFAPSNEEVYNVYGLSSVSFDGVNAEETGTYYLALHDVTATSGSEITLNYLHLDKFLVQSHSVTEMGVLPTAHIMSITGNGLDNVPYVMLRNDKHTIVSDTVITSSKAQAKVLFAFKGDEPLDSYDLVVHFDDSKSIKDIVVKDAVTLAEPRFGDIEITISDPRSVEDPYPVSVTVANTGNITYADIPFFIAYDPVERISMMRYENFYIDADSTLVANGLKDSYIIDNFNGTDNTARAITMSIPYMEPDERCTYVLGFNAKDHENYHVNAFTGTPWSLYTHETLEAVESMAARQGDIVLPGATSSDVPDNHVTMGYITSPLSVCSLNEWGGEDTPRRISSRVSIKKMAFFVLRDVLEALLEALKKKPRIYYPSYSGGPTNNNNGHVSKLTGHIGGAPGNYLGEPIGRNDLLMPFPYGYLRVTNGISDYLDRFVKTTFFKTGVIDWAKYDANQWNPGDPNDILGYTAPSGSKAVGKGVTGGYYTIEFENDPTIANAAAHTIIVRDTLDSRVFDLDSFEPTGIKLGTVMTKVNKDTQFPITIDLRPSINVIAQADLDYNPKTGIAVWKISSLDPMTLEETTDAMQGVLPVNVNGNGQGEVLFNIRFKDEMAHGTEIVNQAGIVFDSESLIMTPTWINVVDTIAPTSAITSYKVKNASEVTLEWIGEDTGSGIWCYDIYAKASPDGLWHVVRNGVEGESTTFTMTEEGEFGFCIVAIDMAGNREHKLMKNELANDEHITDIPSINAPSTSQNGYSAAYDLGGKRTIVRHANVYIKDGRLYVIKK